MRAASNRDRMKSKLLTVEGVETALECVKGFCALQELADGATPSTNGIIETLILLKILSVWAYPRFLKFMSNHKTKRAQKLPKKLREFANLRKATKCPFARNAKLEGIVLPKDLPITAAAQSVVGNIVDFTNRARKNKLDGIILIVPRNPFAVDLLTFATSFNHILRIFAENDPTSFNCFDQDLLSENWQFSFNGIRFFITTFAPFYPDSHARFSCNEAHAFVYLQPEFSFDHHGISAGNSHRHRIKKSIRELFAQAGQAYDVALVTQPVEAYKYVKPMVLGDTPVRWWETKILQ